MYKIKVLIFLSVGLLSGACAGVAANRATLPPLKAIDTKISSWVEQGYYNGAAVMIVKDGKPIFEALYGGFTDTTTLHVASAGKWVASATIASLVDRGLLAWDDPVCKYLPEFTDTKGSATVAQLMSHTAGYPNYQPKEKPTDNYQTLKESVANIIGLAADTLAATKFEYGGLAMQVAGRIAEVVTGKDWETIFQENIAVPLKMKQSAFVPVSQEGGFGPMLGGGLRTSLSDYINFLDMIANRGLFNGKRVLSETAVITMEADHIGNATVRSGEYVECSKANLHRSVYGLGLWREELNSSGRATLISSPGWAGAYPWLDRTNNTYGFILAKANVGTINREGFSAFYTSAILSLMTRDAVSQMHYPEELQSGTADIGDAQLYYEQMGAGEPLILIHGHSLDHKMWDRQMFEFAKKYRVIRYDLRGYGYSSPQTETDQFTHAGDLVKLMNVLNVDKAHLVGLSLGGYICADMLGLHPEKIISAVMCSGNVRGLPKPSKPMTVQEAAKRDKEIEELKQKGIQTIKREWFAGLMRSAGSQREQIRLPLWHMISEWDAWQPLHKEVRVIAGDDAYDKLKTDQPHTPTMILEGRSAGNSFADEPEILRYLPCGKLVIIDDAGHMCNMEQPRKFNQTVIKFITNSSKAK